MLYYSTSTTYNTSTDTFYSWCSNDWNPVYKIDDKEMKMYTIVISKSELHELFNIFRLIRGRSIINQFEEFAKDFIELVKLHVLYNTDDKDYVIKMDQYDFIIFSNIFKSDYIYQFIISYAERYKDRFLYFRSKLDV